jgi:phage regulator Rha-like protein
MNTATDTLLQEPSARYTAVAPPDAAITGRIHLIRGQKVMLDRDLAELYGVEVKRLKEQVRRNSERFPEDFMEPSRSQNATLKRGHNFKYLPFAFTEHGILMLANVLRSEQAIAVSILIIRVFNRMREALLQQQDILAQLEELRVRADGHDVDIAAILRALRQLTDRPAPPHRPLGFKPSGNS